MEKSFQLIRTNPKLTSNVKVVVDSSYNLYLETFQINTILSGIKYKHFAISKYSKYEQMLFKFYAGIPATLAFETPNDINTDQVKTDYQYQFDTTYYAGARNIEDQYYSEEFEYLAPLYLNPNKLPQGFVILRVDDGAVFDPTTGYYIDSLTRDNFRENIIDKWKCVKFFDLSYQSNLGFWMYNNFTQNSSFPSNSFKIDVKSNHSVMCNWYGIDINYGVYGSKIEAASNMFYWEQPHFKLESYITDGFSRNSLIYPHIANFKFLYDDTPADPFELKKYTINRYYGFYADQMDYIMSLTSYNTPTVKSGVVINNNIFMLPNQITGSTNPFETWEDGKEYYIYAFGDLQQVVKIKQNGTDYYKIISNKNISISDINNNGVININFSNTGRSYVNLIQGKYGQDIQIDPFRDKNEDWRGLYGDLYLINIDGKYHILKYQDKPGFNLTGVTIYTGSTTSDINDIYINSTNLYVSTLSGVNIYDSNNNLTDVILTTNYSIINSDSDGIYIGTDSGITKRDIYGNFTYILPSNSNIPSGIVNKVYYKNGYLCAAISGTTYQWWMSSINGYYSGVTGIVYSAITSFEIDGNNLYVGFDKQVRKYFNFDPLSYYEFNSINNLSFPNNIITGIKIFNNILFVSSTNGLWLKVGQLEKLYNSTTGFNIGSNNIKEFAVGTTNKIIYLLVSNNGASDDGLYLLDYTTNDVTTGLTFLSGVSLSLLDDNTVLLANKTNYLLYNLPDQAQSLSRFEFYVQSDYGINSNDTNLEYWIQSKTGSYYTSKNIYTGKSGIKPMVYPIYRVRFTDIRDFDFDRVDTKFADFDYEQTPYVYTPETKLYAKDYTDASIPPDFKKFPTGNENQGIVIDVSSEYIADDELWEVYPVTITPSYNKIWYLNDIWKKNQTICKWSYQDSISHSDYVYKLNNSSKVGYEFNRTTNYKSQIPSITDKNLDYFYRIGDFIIDISGTTKHYKQQSTNIETSLLNSDSRKFNLDSYIASTFDYFEYFFCNYMYYRIDDVDFYKGTKKFSTFNNLNNTLFKGLMIGLQKVDDITYTANEKPKIKYNNYSYEDYKCSIIFNPAYNYFNDDYTQPIVTTAISYVWYNPMWLDAYDSNRDLLGIMSFDSGETYNYGLDYSGFSGLVYRQDANITLAQVWRQYSETDALNNKQLDRFWLKATGFTQTTYTNGYYFENVNTNGDFVLFSGTTSNYYSNSGGSIANLYNLSTSITGNTFISLTLWDEDNFLDNYISWINNGLLYERSESKYFSGGVINNGMYFDNSKDGIHVFLNDKYKNLLILINHKFAMFNRYVDLNNTTTFGENYGLYYGRTLNDSTIFDNYPTYFRFESQNEEFVSLTYDETFSGSTHTSYNNLYYSNLGNNSYTGQTYDYFTNSITIYSGRTLTVNISSQYFGGGPSTYSGVCYVQIDTGFTGNYIDLTAITLYTDANPPVFTGGTITTFNNIFTITQKSNVRFRLNQYLYQSNGSLDFYLTATTFGFESSDHYNPNILTAYNFTNAINWFLSPMNFDQPITYHYISTGGTYISGYTMNIGVVPPYLLQSFSAKELNLKLNSYNVEALQGAGLYNIFNTSGIINEPIARTIQQNNIFTANKPQVYGENSIYELTIYRYDGPYEPIFKDVEIFNKIDYSTIDNQFYLYDSGYKFDDNLYYNFGSISEIIFSKTNPDRANQILKLTNTPDKSIYPMMDEYGLDFSSRFIFKSSWDSEFYTRTSDDYEKLL